MLMDEGVRDICVNNYWLLLITGDEVVTSLLL